MLIPLEVWLIYLFVEQVGPKPLTLDLFLLIQLFLALVVLMFYGLKITVTDDRIKLQYGIGIIRITLDLSEVRSVRIVRNKWYYGWGIRIIPKGMLYNTHGLDAVELSFHNRARIVRVGSPEVEILQYEIKKRISN